MKHKQGQRLFRRPFWTAERAGFPLRPESYGYFSIFFARVQVFLCKLAHFIQLWSKIQQPVLIGQGIGPYGTRHSPSPRRNGACPSAAPRSSAHRGRPASPQARPCLKRRDREPVSPTRSSAAAGYRLPVQSSGDPSALTAYHSFLAGSRLTLKDHVVDVFILTHLIPDTVLLLTKHRHVDLSFPWERHFIISGNRCTTANDGGENQAELEKQDFWGAPQIMLAPMHSLHTPLAVPPLSPGHITLRSHLCSPLSPPPVSLAAVSLNRQDNFPLFVHSDAFFSILPERPAPPAG